MINENFVKELFDLCRKHKQNVTVEIDYLPENDDDVGKYIVVITGKHEVRSDTDAVEIYKQEEFFVKGIKGSLKI